jgi:hypothetical protein
MDTMIRTSSSGRLYQLVELGNRWELRDGRWLRHAVVFTNGRLELWLVPDPEADTRD